jgi:Cu2+-exporting ATPase
MVDGRDAGERRSREGSMAGHDHHHSHGAEQSTAHGGHDGHAGQSRHAGQDAHAGHGKHAGHSVEMFRRRFWWSLLLTVPIVLTSEMVMEWFNYELDFAGIELVGPVLGTIVFLWGGWPFLQGGVREARERQPGMMLLIAMAITVAYTASVATSLDLFDLDFWWELAALVTIMLLGHWQEMKLWRARSRRWRDRGRFRRARRVDDHGGVPAGGQGRR